MTQETVDAWLAGVIARRRDEARAVAIRSATEAREQARRAQRPTPKMRSYLWGMVKVIEG